MSRRIAATALTGAALVLSLLAAAVPAQATEDAKPTRLKAYQELFLAVPEPEVEKHKFKYTARTTYWSVVATSPVTADTDLRLFSDRPQTDQIGHSLVSGNVTDFIAVDSNHRPLAQYFPRVETHSGNGAYSVQLAQGTDTVGATPAEVEMKSNEIVAVRDTLLTAGETYRFTLTPGSALMDADIFLMDSLPLTPDTWVKSRVESLHSGHAPAGEPVVMQFVAPRTDWYGLVIVREGVNGTYDLVRTTP